jgi:menaquinone-dependent protoporphyrinogen oxidase
MSPSILVAYATQGGSTAEVAHALAEVLRLSGLGAEALPVQRVLALDGRAAVLLGAPLYIGRFPREFRRFLTSQRSGLSSLRTWCFILGPTRPEPADFEAARRQAEKQLARYPWLHPVEVHIFGGKWDMKGLRFPFSLARRIPGNPLAQIPPSDIRDWSEIRAWGLGIARKFLPAA